MVGGGTLYRPPPYSSLIAIQVDGSMNLSLKLHFALRLLETDYLCSQLPRLNERRSESPHRRMHCLAGPVGMWCMSRVGQFMNLDLSPIKTMETASVLDEIDELGMPEHSIHEP